MRALVISGGGSKGAFAGGVAEYLLDKEKNKYDIFIGTSTGSLLVTHLALDKIDAIKKVYTSVTEENIFNRCPFKIKNKNGVDIIKINHFNVLINFLRGSNTFGESFNLKKLIKKTITKEDFYQLKSGNKIVVVTVTNLSSNKVEYKALSDFEYDDFCDWIWISCNYIPFMSLVIKNNSEYGDGGFTSLVPIREAINRGATEIDAIILETEVHISPKFTGKNPFSLLVNLFGTLLEQVQKNDITIGKLTAINENVKLNLYYTPTQLTSNALVFNKIQMEKWWKQGYETAKERNGTNKEN
ncbi:patatin-like phospholipase family protein [Flavobacterium sp. WC2421]|jgi:NTE family protein|uniref:patatin-like phospholipase family protein n=1 Tax=Flavobacterium sp. WC2421 TaxID=3234138 RepID=UPI0034675CAE